MSPDQVMHILAVMQPEPGADPGELVRSAMALWLTLLCAGAILVLGLWVILVLRRKHRRARAREGVPGRAPIKDAWAESARRLEVQPPESPEDDDLRVDR